MKDGSPLFGLDAVLGPKVAVRCRKLSDKSFFLTQLAHQICSSRPLDLGVSKKRWTGNNPEVKV